MSNSSQSCQTPWLLSDTVHSRLVGAAENLLVDLSVAAHTVSKPQLCFESWLVARHQGRRQRIGLGRAVLGSWPVQPARLVMP